MRQSLAIGLTIARQWETSGRRVAVKKFSKKDEFEQELNALQATRKENHPRLIRFLSSCEKANTYYILLPWADGSTLNRFWENNCPKTRPRNRELIRKSLNQLVHLSDALRVFHALNFRHGDLKPDNILHFTNRSGQIDSFVIADLGISRHHHRVTGLRNEATLTRATTATYEAPEVFTDAASGKPRPRRYDVWSLGCIILEYVVWLLWDISAVDAMTSAREHPAFAFYLTRRDFGVRTAIVHPEVTRAMETLREDRRCGKGTALYDLLDLVENHLLVVGLDRRCEAAQAYAAVLAIARKAGAAEPRTPEMGDAYVLPRGAPPPAPRPEIFQLKAPHGARGTPQS